MQGIPLPCVADALTCVEAAPRFQLTAPNPLCLSRFCRCFSEAIKEKPDYATAFHQRGLAYVQLFRYNQVSFDRCLEVGMWVRKWVKANGIVEGKGRQIRAGCLIGCAPLNSWQPRNIEKRAGAQQRLSEKLRVQLCIAGRSRSWPLKLLTPGR
jgi:hypothetical protein